ncbi:MAG: surface-adhesin E family protein, partial [Nitrospiraceae bacterium]
MRPSLMRPLACIAGCWFLITLLVLTSGSVDAEWVAIDERYQSPGLQTVYIDPATIHREGNRVTMEILVDWKWGQGNRSPSRFLSTTTHKEFDCAQKRLRLLAHSSFLKHMGTGRRNDGYV